MKNNIRITAFLLALLMVMAVLPIVSAVEDHTHTYANEFTIDEEATCEKAGKKSKHCTFKGCTDRTEETDIPKKDHVFSKWNTTKYPTCETEGEETSYCDTCMTATKTRPIKATNHNWTEWRDDPDNRPTCKGNGKGGKQIRYCTNPGCEKGGSETRDVDAPDHVWSEYFFTTKPTCSKEGSKYRICRNCQDKQTVTIEPLGKNQTEGHNFGAWETVSKGTCKAKGQEKRVCPDCKREEYRETEYGKHVVKTDKTAKGKEFSWYASPQPSLERKGRKVQYCKVCKKVIKSKEYAPDNYHYDMPVYGFGPMAGSVSTQLAGSLERLIPVDLTTPGEKYYALVSQDNKLIGQAVVAVVEGTLSVNYRLSDPRTVVKQAVFYFYPSALNLTAQDLNDPTKAYQFGQALPTGGLTSCVISPRLIVNYDSDNPGNRVFQETGLYIDGVSNNAEILQQMSNELINGFAAPAAPAAQEAPAEPAAPAVPVAPAAPEAPAAPVAPAAPEAPAEPAAPAQNSVPVAPPQPVVPVIPGN